MIRLHQYDVYNTIIISRSSCRSVTHPKPQVARGRPVRRRGQRVDQRVVQCRRRHMDRRQPVVRAEHREMRTCMRSWVDERRTQRYRKLRIVVILRFGTARQKMVLE
jgi:hypothetical protein